MKQKEFDLLEKKILSDKDFVKSLMENPEQALDREGIRLTMEVLEAIKGVDGAAFEKLIAASQPVNSRN
ncbi:MAG: hypothetical protein H6635_10160 [Anaerolineales bacterium]|nr:hypothetical protein [Anaerolineales bacterium]MCB9145724.1 hypothetical protein [Anaerolineales bacterium]